MLALLARFWGPLLAAFRRGAVPGGALLTIPMAGEERGANCHRQGTIARHGRLDGDGRRDSVRGLSDT